MAAAQEQGLFKKRRVAVTLDTQTRLVVARDCWSLLMSAALWHGGMLMPLALLSHSRAQCTWTELTRTRTRVSCVFVRVWLPMLLLVLVVVGSQARWCSSYCCIRTRPPFSRSWRAACNELERPPPRPPPHHCSQPI